VPRASASIQPRSSPRPAARSLPRPCRSALAPTQSRQVSSVNHMPNAGAHVVPTGVKRDQGGQPTQRQADVGDNQSVLLEERGGGLVARVASDKKADGNELPSRLPFRQPRHRNTDAT